MTVEPELICFLAPNGTTGDVMPLARLAAAMRGRGFAVAFLGDPAFRRLAIQEGLREEEWSNSVDQPFDAVMRTERGQRVLRGRRPAAEDRELVEELAWSKRRNAEDFLRRYECADNPRIAAAVTAIGGWRLAHRFGAGCAKITSGVMPYQPSSRFSLDPPDLNLWAQAWRCCRRRDFSAIRHPRFVREMYHLVAVSAHVFPRPADWAAHLQVTGFIEPPAAGLSWTPWPGLAAFLAAGDAPVYIGFGSYPFFSGRQGGYLAQEALAGVKLARARCLVHSPDLAPEFSSPDVLVLDHYVPHAWLFPRCKAIVHHGGYGTTHASLTAGRPMVIYPYQTDQFLWGRLMHRLRVAPPFRARLHKITSRGLRSDLELIAGSATLQRAEALRRQIALERGLAFQIAAIESIIAHHRRGLTPQEWTCPI